MRIQARTAMTRAVAMAGGVLTALALGPVGAAADAAPWEDVQGRWGPRATGWGTNHYGQTGTGAGQTHYAIPAEVAGWPQIKPIAVATGETHTLGVGKDRTLQSWGGNHCGQLGTTGGSRKVPGPVAGAPGNLYDVAAGRDFSLALTGTGQVYAWGCNDKGQLGLGAPSGPVNTPTLVPGLSGIIQLDAGYDHALALTWDGFVYAWGLNDDGEVGDGTSAPRPAPVYLPGIKDVRAVAAGMHHSLAVRNNDELFSWGRNAAGQLGVGSPFTDRLAPVRVPMPAPVQNVTAGGHHSLALMANRQVYAFGDNGYGQLGLADKTGRATPTLISSLGNIANVSAGADFSLVQRYKPNPGSSTHVYSWGRNNNGQLGTGSTAPDDSQPKRVDTPGSEIQLPLVVHGAFSGASSRHAVAIGVGPLWLEP